MIYNKGFNFLYVKKNILDGQISKQLV